MLIWFLMPRTVVRRRILCCTAFWRPRAPEWGTGFSDPTGLELVAKGAESTGRSIVTRGWCTVEERKALQKSANSYEANGDTARHAVDNGRWKPGDPKLSIEEGQALVSRLVNLWLQSLA